MPFGQAPCAAPFPYGPSTTASDAVRVGVARQEIGFCFSMKSSVVTRSARRAAFGPPLSHSDTPGRCLQQPTSSSRLVKCHLSSKFWVYAEQLSSPRKMWVMYIDTLTPSTSPFYVSLFWFYINVILSPCRAYAPSSRSGIQSQLEIQEVKGEWHVPWSSNIPRLPCS